ncbi:hypothetical protein [Bifidobacterium olomucense]|uniref:hypothetical protein n=1 Tax=Bifidobacterium olomucense TaxID=2675324 RepID=UPI00145D4EB3|nr:hypothetical protein [Bifidobacterium sp. DSM 109959]
MMEDSKECWYQCLTDAAAAESDDSVKSTESVATSPSADDTPFGEPYNLWDAERGAVIRHVNASWLDVHAQTGNGMDAFLTQTKRSHVDELVIHDDRPECANPNYQALSRRTIEAFRATIQTNGIACEIDRRT